MIETSAEGVEPDPNFSLGTSARFKVQEMILECDRERGVPAPRANDLTANMKTSQERSSDIEVSVAAGGEDGPHS